MIASTDTRIVFTVGRYNTEQTTWLDASNAPSAAVDEQLFRSIFDAAGEPTIDTDGDIDPDVLLGLVGLGPHGYDESTAWLRLVCRWARCRGLRVHFGTEVDDADDRAIRSA